MRPISTVESCKIPPNGCISLMAIAFLGVIETQHLFSIRSSSNVISVKNGTQFLNILVEVIVRGRNVTVKGPRGMLNKCFKHAAVDIKKQKNTVSVERWFANRKEMATVRSIVGHIQNMFKGVTKGYRYKMRSVYPHFPINCTIDSDGKGIEIRNFLGEKRVRRLRMSPGVKIAISSAVKDELILDGNSLDNVSLSAAMVHQATLVRNKDIRHFLDGVYVSEKTTCEQL